MFFLWLLILVVLVGAIVALGLRIGALEGWTPTNAIYFAFITATSVGYGDFHPTETAREVAGYHHRAGRGALTGLIVAIGLEAVLHASPGARGRRCAPVVP